MASWSASSSKYAFARAISLSCHHIGQRLDLFARGRFDSFPVHHFGSRVERRAGPYLSGLANAGLGFSTQPQEQHATSVFAS